MVIRELRTDAIPVEQLWLSGTFCLAFEETIRRCVVCELQVENQSSAEMVVFPFNLEIPLPF